MELHRLKPRPVSRALMRYSYALVVTTAPPLSVG